MARKTKVLDLLARAYGEQQAWAARLPEGERQAAGTPEHWAAKDLWAHVVAWAEHLANSLAAVVAGQAPPRPVDDVDQANAELFAAHRDDTWETIADRAARAYRALAEQTQALDEVQLASTDLLPRQGRPLWRMIVGEGYTHPVLHLAAYDVDHGRMETATGLEEEAAARQWNLDDGAGWRGTVRYNQACYYALAGEKERALALLAEAFSLAPELQEWSKQDTDLDSLREEPAYRALLG